SARGAVQDHARIRRAPVRRRARPCTDAGGVRALGQRTTRRARALSDLRAPDLRPRRRRHAPPSGPARHRPTRSALGVWRRRDRLTSAMPGRGAEPRLPVLTGRAWSFADHLAAHDILPARFGSLAPADAAGRLFADLDPTLAARFGRGDVLVAGQGLGGGPGEHAAARALAAAGVAAVVAGGFAGGVPGGGLAAGLPPLAGDAPRGFSTRHP